MVDVRYCLWDERAKEKVLRSFSEGYLWGTVTTRRKRQRLTLKTNETNFLILSSLNLGNY